MSLSDPLFDTPLNTTPTLPPIAVEMKGTASCEDLIPRMFASKIYTQPPAPLTNKHMRK